MSSSIEWTDEAWNPVVGCTPVSTGCLNCYAARMARRQEAMGTKGYEPRHREELLPLPNAERLENVWCRCGGEVWYQDLYSVGKASRQAKWEAFCRKCKACDPNGYSSHKVMLEESPKFWGVHRFIRIAEVKAGRAVFTGEVRCLPDRLMDPLGWRRPRKVFVNSMSDLFHEKVPFEFVDQVLAVAALCQQHTFQIVTKRPERMAEYFADAGTRERIVRAMHERNAPPAPQAWRDASAKVHYGEWWPLPNVWLLTSVESQAAADARIPHLLRCPAVVRGLSVEPMVGPVDLSRWLDDGVDGPVSGGMENPPEPAESGLHWVIVGGESGPKARACDVAWIRSIVAQCKAAGVACFVKQLGARPFDSARMDAVPGSRRPVTEAGLRIPEQADQFADVLGKCIEAAVMKLRDRKGGDPAEWPEDLRVREFPEVRA